MLHVFAFLYHYFLKCMFWSFCSFYFWNRLGEIRKVVLLVFYLYSLILFVFLFFVAGNNKTCTCILILCEMYVLWVFFFVVCFVSEKRDMHKILCRSQFDNLNGIHSVWYMILNTLIIPRHFSYFSIKPYVVSTS